MPALTVTVPHQLEHSEAVERLKKMSSQLRARHAADVSQHDERWTDDQLHYEFQTPLFSTAGIITVAADNVELTGEMPLAALPFKGQIEDAVRQRLKQLLA